MFSLTSSLKANARNIPNNIATIMGELKRTWREVEQNVAKLASGLKSLGVQEGDRVAILSFNSDKYYECQFASWWAGAVIVPLNIRLAPNELMQILNDSEAKVLIIDDTFAPLIPTVNSQVKYVQSLIFIGEGDTPDGAHSYDKLVLNNTPCADAEKHNDDLAGLYYTSGTTGLPKGAMLSHSALMFNNLSCGAHGHYYEHDIYLHAAPMFHTADSANSGAASLYGATHMFIPVFDPSKVIKAVEENKVTCTVLVPTMIDMVLAHPEFSPEKFSSLRRLIYGASPMPQALLIKLINTLPELEIVQGYGMTEMGPIISILPNNEHKTEGATANRINSAGRPAAGVDVKICDDDGNEVPTDSVGEIVVRSPGMMQGYWNKPNATSDAIRNGWMHSGDCGFLNEDGFLFIVDRKKDMIVTGGENVYSAEVENAISLHPNVAAVAVIGIPSEKWGEEVHAIIIENVASLTSEEDITDHCRTMIANYKIPRSYTFRTESFPLSGAGKVLKRALRDPFWEEKQRAV